MHMIVFGGIMHRTRGQESNSEEKRNREDPFPEMGILRKKRGLDFSCPPEISHLRAGFRFTRVEPTPIPRDTLGEFFTAYSKVSSNRGPKKLHTV